MCKEIFRQKHKERDEKNDQTKRKNPKVLDFRLI